jgi:hypothetical protein
VGPWFSPDALEKRKIVSLMEIKPRPSRPYPVAILTAIIVAMYIYVISPHIFCEFISEFKAIYFLPTLY